MPPGGSRTPGGPGNVVDGNNVLPRRRRVFIRRSTEKTNPGNLDFKRKVAALEATQEQQRHKQMAAFLGSCYRAGLPYLKTLSTDEEEGENQIPCNGVSKLPGPSAPMLLEAGTQHSEERLLKDSANPLEEGEIQIPCNDVSELPGPSAPMLPEAGTQHGEKRLLKDSAKPPDDTDFLEGTFIKRNSDKQKARRNKKNSEKKGKGKGRKQSHASEIKSEPSPIKTSSTCADVAGSESLVFSSSHVAAGVPLLEYSSPSSSGMTQILINNPASSGASSEKELYSSSNDEFNSFDGSTSYSTAASSSVNDYYTGGNAWNSNMGDYAGSFSGARSELPLSASECIDSRGFKKRSDEGSKPNDRQSFSLAIGPGDGSHEEGSLCRDYASNGGNFQKVISRKAAQKMKRMQRLETPAMPASAPIIARALVPSAPRREVITVGHYMKEDCIYGREPNHKIKGKTQKGPSLRNVSKTGYTNGENAPGSSRMLLITAHTGKPGSSQMALSSTSRHHATLEDIEETSSTGCLPMEGELKAPVGGDTERTDSTATSFDKISSLGNNLANSSCVDREEQKDQDNEQALSTHVLSDLDKIIKTANDAYKVQVASNGYMIYGIHANIETFLYSATPVIARVSSCTTNNISLQNHCLWSVWRWYEEPECRGIEVEMQGSINSSWANSSTYFVPSLSAVQLFGQSGNKFSTPEEPCLLSQNHGELFFEYFESEKPFLQPPLFTKIKQLLNGVKLSGNQKIFGDPKQLKSVKLCDLHPASWFCVSWYPICQIPSASRSRQEAAFLTYHSLGKLVPQTTYMADGLHHIVCPVVGLLGYRDQGEKWYQLAEQTLSKPTPNGSWKTLPAELLNKKMRALRHCASIMSKAVVPRASGQAMNYHPHYGFFWSRSQ